MRRSQIAAFIVLGGCILLLGPALSSSLMQPAEKPKPGSPRPTQPRKVREEPKQDRGNPQPVRQPAKADPDLARAAKKNPMPWFADLDRDGDGRVSPEDWRTRGRNADEFRELDLNGDGFITPDEFLHDPTNTKLKFRNGRVVYHGSIEENMEETYKGTRTFKILTIKLEEGKTYQIDVTSKVLPPFVLLEDPDGTPLKSNARLMGGSSRIRYQADSSGVYRIVVASFRTGPFSCSVSVVNSVIAKLPKVLASLLEELDKDEDGQIALYEWRKAGKKVADFRPLDRNGDGFSTPEELLHTVKDTPELKFQNGRATYNGEVEEREEIYKGKRAYRFLAVKLEKGKTYQIDLTSKVFQAFLYLEGLDGNTLKQHSSPTIGGNSRIIHRTDRAGMYRIVVTSLGGFRTGPFTCSVRAVESTLGPRLSRGLVPWFKELDKDGDGQIALYEWRKAGMSADEFRELDLNDDGFLPREELRRYVKKLGR